MTTRVLLADLADARFYDIEPGGSAMRCVSMMSCPNAHLHDRDLKSDRPGRVFDHAAASGHRRGAVAHHSTGGEETPRRHEATTFAHHIVEALELGRNAHEFNRLVLIAAPRFMGTLRMAMPKHLAELVTLEVVKDLMHGGEEAIRAHLPVSVLRAKSPLPA
jgi:protein required for attachment to host cells